MNIEPVPFEQLLSLASGELTPELAGRVTAMVRSSPDTAATLEQIRQVLQTLRSDDTKMPSAPVVERAVAAFGQRRKNVVAPQSTGWLDTAARIIVELVFDSRRTPALAGFRGGGPGYQLAYQCEFASIDLHVSPPDFNVDCSWKLRGQVSFEHGGRAADLALVNPQTRETLERASTDDRGCFKLVAPRGEYDLLIHAQSDTLLVPALEIG